MLEYHNVYQRVVKCVCMLTAHNAQQHTSPGDIITVVEISPEGPVIDVIGRKKVAVNLINLM